MEIKFCLGNITGRGKEVALKFDFDDKLVEQLKKVLNRYRYLFQKQTNMQAWQAGGWLAEKRVCMSGRSFGIPLETNLLS